MEAIRRGEIEGEIRGITAEERIRDCLGIIGDGEYATSLGVLFHRRKSALNFKETYAKYSNRIDILS